MRRGVFKGRVGLSEPVAETLVFPNKGKKIEEIDISNFFIIQQRTPGTGNVLCY